MLKSKLEKKMAEDEKYLIRDRQAFERHFGKQPRTTTDERVRIIALISMILVCQFCEDVRVVKGEAGKTY